MIEIIQLHVQFFNRTAFSNFSSVKSFSDKLRLRDGLGLSV